MTIYRKWANSGMNFPPQEFTEFAVTLTLNPKMTDQLCHQDQYKLIIGDLVDRIQKAPLLYNTVISLELTKKHNLHIHLLLTTKLSWNVKTITTLIETTFHKHDKEGRPCYFERSGMIRVPKVLEYVTEDECYDQHVWYMEQVCQRIRESHQRGNKVSTFIYIMDLKGLSMWPDVAAIRIYRKVFRYRSKLLSGNTWSLCNA